MLVPWLELPSVAARLHWASAVAGIDLVELGTTGSADDIRDTSVAQPLLVALALAVGTEIAERSAEGAGGSYPAVLAGHSVGEYAAASLASCLTAESALVLVRERGRAMAKASALTPTGMSAVLGGDAAEVAQRLDELGLTAANVNTAGQVVAAGSLDALQKLAAEPPAGARVRALQVAGAFHTHYMSSARDALVGLAAGTPRRDPATTLLGNGDGAVVQHGDEVVDRLVEQVARPVRWDQCMSTLTELGVTAVIELPPAGTLVGLVKRAMPGVEALAIKSPDDLATAVALVDRHAPVHAEAGPSWRVAVAPVAGTFHAREVGPGSELAPGDTVGVVVSNRSESTVEAAHGGVLVEWLAEDGDPVSPGQAIARLHPLTEAVHA